MRGADKVYDPEEEYRPTHEARQSRPCLSRPHPAHRRVRNEHQRQRRKDDERGRDVDEPVRDQPDFVCGSDRPLVVESGASPGPDIASRMGLNSSIGMGNTIVVFFS
jgi:hypothetical protein